jgi:hypothetical protein
VVLAVASASGVVLGVAADWVALSVEPPAFAVPDGALDGKPPPDGVTRAGLLLGEADAVADSRVARQSAASDWRS